MSEAVSYLCTLPWAGTSLAYHVSVNFAGSGECDCVRFTSFVGVGRRSFTIRADADADTVAARGTLTRDGEALCRLAIGQALRDALHDKTLAGDHLLDALAAPWQGELRPVRSRDASRPARSRLQSFGV
ncbi:hypothetical protein KZ686_05820 [Cupriavidus cauae]|uniref:Uncharacterized protein n=1 Tax=Cupriavidus cauae TaxID=2608999 RepID=A0A5M8A8Z7_9BURK|nr:hypothetical protein [Cupriavidus cauae]KAA0178729.1 hypothetical protein FX016_23555 [Cupriavidus gilardii]KAA6117484.1 hypothetical protein F1599_23435 [Cupriavidus cauae]UZN50106.1 hypothetical protein KZ686_05820 [Cupriavidus cauae]